MKIENIVVATSGNLTGLTEYFDFNQIPYTQVDLWNTKINGCDLNIASLQENNTLLVVSNMTFIEICSCDNSKAQLIEFCKNNKIWVWADMDGLIQASTNQKLLIQIDQLILSGSILLFFDGNLSAHHKFLKLQNIQYTIIPYSFFIRYPRITNAQVDKHNCSRDFMLTAVKKHDRPHRDVLWNQLIAIPGLVDHGYVSYGSGVTRIGMQSHQQTWSDGHPSMDLYLDSWLEIVPETAYRDIYYVTEKTVKPIATKTPFLIVSNRYYLDYLRELGFKTFDTLIDEQYDQQARVEDRVQLMLLQLQDIIKNGSESFYKECALILEHNQHRLFEINGQRQYNIDMFIAQHLDQIGIC